MDKLVIYDILTDQRAELEALRNEKLIHRPEERKINLKSKLAQVIIGVRRSGKSTLCFNALESAGVKYAYINFDDERLYNIRSEELNDIIEGLYRVYGDFEYLFLDEIQNVDGWPLFVNRLLRQRLHLIITGSNAKLLSTDLATHLTGRHHTIELYPFSFKEWCELKGVRCGRLTTQNRGLLLNAFDEYLRIGGFPELIFEDNSKSYINSLFNDILNQDIKHRFNVRNIDELSKMAHHLLNEVPVIAVQSDLQKTFDIKSNHTVTRYLSYLSQTYLISKLSKYSAKSKQRARNEKYYTIDVAFMDKRENAFAKDNLGWRLETIVYLELRRRYPTETHDIYYIKDKSSETDFVVCEGCRTVAVYQVSYDISALKTRKREVRGCINGAKATKCDKIYLITNSDREDIEIDGYKIAVRPAYEWLTSETV